MKPNIVLFMTDQLRKDALGCYGNNICQTPNLDFLAENGACFENAYTPCPVCSPARASLMTGLYPHNHGVMLNTHIAPAWTRGLSHDHPVFSSLLKEAGYNLDYVGKWHVHQDIGPCEYGFDRHDFGEGTKGNLKSGSDIYIDFPGGNSQLVAGTDATDEKDMKATRQTTLGIEMLQERAASDEPFFLRIDLTEPHFACIPPEPYASMYDPENIPPWPNFLEETFEDKPQAHRRKHEEWHLEDKSWDWWAQVLAKYYGLVSYVDACVGRVLDAVDKAGIADETIFIFSSDHGDAMGSHRHFEKGGTSYEEVLGIPMIVRGPDSLVTPGRIHSFVRLLDLAPTFTDWAGTEWPEPIDGMSLAPLLRGETLDKWPDSLYTEFHGEVWGYQSQRMVRTKHWKYVYNPSDKDELYDLQNDPYEISNLAENEAYKDILSDMKARLLGWNDATEDMFQWHWVRYNFPDPIPP